MSSVSSYQCACVCVCVCVCVCACVCGAFKKHYYYYYYYYYVCVLFFSIIISIIFTYFLIIYYFYFVFFFFLLLLQIPVTCYMHIYVHNSCVLPFNMGCFYCKKKGTGNKLLKKKIYIYIYLL